MPFAASLADRSSCYSQIVNIFCDYPTEEAQVDPESHIPLKPDAFQILLVLLDGPRHGYALMRDLAESSGGRLVLLPGALYRRLRQLLDDGLIEERDDGHDSDSRRRTLGVTAFGRAVAVAEAARLEGLVEAARARDLIKRKAEAKS